MTRRLFLLPAFGLLALSFGTAQIPAPAGAPLEFEVASVKAAAPDARGTMINIGNGMLTVKNSTFKELVATGYSLRDFQITGGPGWIANDRFDIEAKSEAMAAAPKPQSMTDEQRTEFERQFKERLRSLLAERFQLVAHTETKEMPIYALVQAKGGSKPQPAKEVEGGNRGMRMQRGVLTGTSAPVDMIANAMSDSVGRPVVDKTGLGGKFDWKLEWTPDAGQLQPKAPGQTQEAAPAPDLSGPSLFTALQEQLGLKLESQKGPAPILVIDKVEKPSAN